MSVLVVDGDSPDGTAAIVRQKALTYGNVRLLSEPEKSGIGAAYMLGFSYAKDTMRADVIIEFDADFQHPPETIPMLLAKAMEGYDYVLGSRMIRGGGQTSGRSRFRTMLSKWGGLLARFILFFPSRYFHEVTDPTTGLRLTRVKGCLDQLDLDPAHLYSRKFGYKVQLLAETLMVGAHYAEIPLAFGDRAGGRSKIEVGTALEILLACLQTRIRGVRGGA
jgi:dolichol-phosphate mannosyltransferase